MKHETALNRFLMLRPCPDGKLWGGYRKSLYDGWRACERPDWLIWFADKVGIEPRLVIGAVLACTRAVLDKAPPPEHEILVKALAVVEKSLTAKRRMPAALEQARKKVLAIVDSPKWGYTNSPTWYASRATSYAIMAAGYWGSSFDRRTYSQDAARLAAMAKSDGNLESSAICDAIRQVIPYEVVKEKFESLS